MYFDADDRHPPQQHHSATSGDAADSIRPTVPRLQARVLRYVEQRGHLGCTDEELTTGTGLPVNTARPRRIELTKAGHLRDSGTTRPTRSGRKATVWIINTTTPGTV